MSVAAQVTDYGDYVLDRNEVLPKIVGDPDDFLFIAGLAGTAKDTAAMTKDGDNAFMLAGAMGAATSMGLGLALARPDKKVLVLTGDGELLMNVGSLATLTVMNPGNLGVICVDNGHYGETGYQKSHTSLGVDLEQIAIGSGFKSTMTVSTMDDVDGAARMVRESNSPYFILIKVKPTDPPKFKRNLDPAEGRIRFRRALLQDK